MTTATQTAINFEVGHLEILTGTIPLLSNELLYTPDVIIIPEASVADGLVWAPPHLGLHLHVRPA